MKLKKRANGFYYIYYGRDNRKSLKTRNGDEATKLFNMEKDLIKKGKVVEFEKKSRITLNQFKDEYLKAREQAIVLGDITEGTLKNDTRAFKNFIEAVGDIPVRKVDRDIINKFKSKLLLVSKLMERERRKNGINILLRSLKAAFTFAISKGYIEKNPFFKPIGQRKDDILFNIENKKPRFFETKQVLALQDALLRRIASIKNELQTENLPEVRVKVLQNRLVDAIDFDFMVNFYINTGLRRSELLRLYWTDINFELSKIHIRHAKSKKERYVPMTDELKSRITAYGVRDIGRIFARWHCPDYISRKFSDLAKEAGVYITSDGIESIKKTLHSTRHTFGTHAVMSGMHQKAIQKALGHSSSTTTDIYVNIVDEMMDSEIKKFKIGGNR